MLCLPLAFLALVPSGAVAPALYDVIRAVSAVFPFKPTLDALDAALNDAGGIGGPLLHLAGLTLAFGAWAAACSASHDRGDHRTRMRRGAAATSTRFWRWCTRQRGSPILGANIGTSVYLGHDGMREWFRDLHQEWETFETRVTRIDERATGRCARLRARSRAGERRRDRR